MRPDYRKTAGDACRPFDKLPLAVVLDRLADCELQAGHHGRAEHLSRQAAELRLVGGDRQDRRVPRS